MESKEPHLPSLVMEQDEEKGTAVALLSLVPDFRLKDHHVEAVFLVDCSGSMQGQSMQLAKEALQLFLNSLPVSSFFNIIIFGNSHMSLFPISMPYTDDSLKDAKHFVSFIDADMGGTEIFKPLESILQAKPAQRGVPKQVFVLTDGQVWRTVY